MGKIRNFLHGKGWRDDNLQENYQQKDWEKVTAQLKEKFGIPKDAEVRYSEEEIIPGYTTSGHYTAPTDDFKKKVITMTKGGYEGFDENNLNNSINSFIHEKDHARNSSTRFKKAEESKTETAKMELEAVQTQRNDKSWSSTTSSYKVKINNFENKFKAEIQ